MFSGGFRLVASTLSSPARRGTDGGRAEASSARIWHMQWIRAYVKQLVELFAQALSLLKSSGTLSLSVPDVRGRWPAQSLRRRSGGRQIHEVSAVENAEKDAERASDGAYNSSLEAWLSLPSRVAHVLVESGYRFQEEFVWWGVEQGQAWTGERVHRNHQKLFLFSKGPSFNFSPIALEGVSVRAPLSSV